MFQKQIEKFLNNLKDDLVKLLRENVLYLLAKLDDIHFHEYALKLYQNRLSVKIPCNLQKPVYSAILMKGTSETLEDFVKMYIESKIPEEKEKIALLLAEIEREDLVQVVLDFSFSV